MKCLHLQRRGVFGDEINWAYGRRQMCLDCGKYLKGNLVRTDTEMFYGTDALLALVYEELGNVV